jgi:phage head maturation protease
MKLTGTFTLDAAVNRERRTIIGQVVPYGETGNPGLNGEGIQLEVTAGGLTWDPDNLPKLRSTHHTEPIGRAVTLDESPTGLVATFKVSNTQAGTDALTLASDGLQAGLSIEADAPDGITASTDGVYRLTADNPATLTAVALVESPAFTNARVHQVAAQQKETATMTDKVTAAEVPDEVVSTLVTALQSLVESQTTAADPATEEAPMEAAQALPQRKLTATTTVTREAFPYGHPGADGASYFSDLLASRRDTLAAQRVEKAQSIWQIAAANEPVQQTDVTIPNVYQDALLVNLPRFPRDFADNIPSTAISSARPILVPVVDAVTADGGSGEVVASHSEGTNPAQGEVDIDYDTYTPGVYSGMFDINREALDAGSPGMDELLFGFLRRSYDNVTDAAAYTAIAGYSGIDTGSSTTDASNTIEAQNMVSTVLSEMAAFKARAGYPANIIWMAPSEFVDVTSLNATDGRPIFPYVNPQNTSGQAGEANYGDIYINGVRTINAVNAATTKVVVANTAALHRWESPLLQFRWEEVAGPAKVRIVCFGYCLTSVLDARGVSLITQA